MDLSGKSGKLRKLPTPMSGPRKYAIKKLEITIVDILIVGAR